MSLQAVASENMDQWKPVLEATLVKLEAGNGAIHSIQTDSLAFDDIEKLRVDSSHRLNSLTGPQDPLRRLPITRNLKAARYRNLIEQLGGPTVKLPFFNMI